MKERSPVVEALVTRMRKAARELPDGPLEASDCLFSAAAVLELIDYQHRELFDQLSKSFLTARDLRDIVR